MWQLGYLEEQGHVVQSPVMENHSFMTNFIYITKVQQSRFESLFQQFLLEHRRQFNMYAVVHHVKYLN